MLNFLSSGAAKRAPVVGYAIAVLAFAVGMANLALLHTTAPLATCVLVVIVSAWFGGTGPGMLATALSVPALVYFLPPNGAWDVDADHVQRLGYFLLISGFIVWIIAAERRTAASLRDVIETIPVIAWTARADGTNEYTNRSWHDYTGKSLTDTSGTGWQLVVHPDDIGRHVEKWQAVVTNPAPFENAARYRGADGEYRWFLVRAVPLRDERGNLLRWYGILIDIEDRARAEQALRESAGRLQHLSRRLLEVQEEERRHLARELHDEFGQLLAGVSLHLHAAKDAAGEAARAKLEQSIALVERAGERARGLVLELRPAIMETAGLDGTLRWLAGQHEQQTGIATQVVGQAGEVPSELAIACFRVAQEALTNVARHARAQRAWIELSVDDGALQLVVRDDGAGFDVEKTLKDAAGSGHVGLLGMRERVQILGGDLRIESAPREGTRVRVSLPLKPRS